MEGPIPDDPRCRDRSHRRTAPPPLARLARSGVRCKRRSVLNGPRAARSADQPRGSRRAVDVRRSRSGAALHDFFEREGSISLSAQRPTRISRDAKPVFRATVRPVVRRFRRDRRSVRTGRRLAVQRLQRRRLRCRRSDGIRLLPRFAPAPRHIARARGADSGAPVPLRSDVVRSSFPRKLLGGAAHRPASAGHWWGGDGPPRALDCADHRSAPTPTPPGGDRRRRRRRRRVDTVVLFRLWRDPARLRLGAGSPHDLSAPGGTAHPRLAHARPRFAPRPHRPATRRALDQSGRPLREVLPGPDPPGV